jgi:type IV pilus assembly protein PilN
MIRVNLLPVRAQRKKENVRRQVSIFFLLIFLGVCTMGYIWFDLGRKISSMNDDIAKGQQELQKLEVINRRVKEIKDKLAELEAKMDIIQRLEANRTGSVKVMDELTGLVVAQKMWLTSLSEAGGRMTLMGVAVDNKTVADFMRRLEKSPYFTNVGLSSSKRVTVGTDNRRFKEFSIGCQALLLQPPQ